MTSVSAGLAAEADDSARKVRCTPAPGQLRAVKMNNIEAILDDSSSMRLSDPDRLRVAGLELFVNDPDNARKTLGVVEFGTTAATVFGPLNIGVNRQFMINQMRSRLAANNFGTNYDAGFVRGRSDNPNAQARIFVTDGVPDDFNDTHRPGPRTFVVGIGIGQPGEGNTNANRLQRIAVETGGAYFPDVAAATLQPTFKTISAAMNCLPRPRRFKSRVFFRQGQERTRRVPMDRGREKLDMTLTWANPGNRFKIKRLDLISPRGRVLADLSGKGKPRKIRVDRSRTKTSRTLRFTKPRRGTRLRFTIKATRLVKRASTITLLGQQAKP